MTDNGHVRRFGIVGAGTIGAGIARLLSEVGATVIVVAPRPGGVGRAAEMLRLSYKVDIDRGRISAAEAEARVRDIHLTSSYSDLDGWSVSSNPSPKTSRRSKTCLPPSSSA